MSLEAVISALGLPRAAMVDRRVAKALLIERTALTATDRRMLEGSLDRLTWCATLRPAAAGVPAFNDDLRDYREIVIMTAQLRLEAKPVRMTEVIHRAIAHPLVLVCAQPEGAVMSVGLKRRHERDVARVIVERLVVAPAVADEVDRVTGDFLAALNLANLPGHDLWAVHRAWSDRIDALRAARITGVYRVPNDEMQADRRREALAEYESIADKISRLRKAAAADRRLSRRIDLAHEIGDAEIEQLRVLDELN